MKKLFTLAAAGTLAAASLGAQAQVAVDGVLTAPELTAGNYQLIGKYTNARGFGDAGLISLYAASTSTKLYFFVGGTVEPNGNAFQLFLDLPGSTGVPVGTALPVGAATTSFEKMAAKLELAADHALALRSDGSATPAVFQVEGAAYTSATAGSSAKLTTTAGTLAGTGTAITLPATTTVGNYAVFNGARIAYRNTTDNKIQSNPTYSATPATSTTYGGVGVYGWEIEIDRTAAGLTGTPNVGVFVLQNNGDGGYLSSDFIPQTPTPATANNGNLGTNPDFTTIAGRQSAGLTLGANGVTLATKSANDALVGINVFPNPAYGRTTVTYNVASQATPVRVSLTDLMGREVRVLETATKNAGTQAVNVNTAGVAAGTYLVRVQVGEVTSVRKVVLL